VLISWICPDPFLARTESTVPTWTYWTMWAKQADCGILCTWVPVTEARNDREA